MKPALIVAIVLAFAIHLAPRCDAKEKPAEAAACSNEQHSSALAAVLAIAVYAHEQGSAFDGWTLVADNQTLPFVENGIRLRISRRRGNHDTSQPLDIHLDF